MKVNNRWLYCGLTFLTVTLLLTSTHSMEEEEEQVFDWTRTDCIWGEADLYNYYQNRLPTSGRHNWPCDRRSRFPEPLQSYLVKWDENRYYEGNYDEGRERFTAHDGDKKDNVSINDVYQLNQAFRKGDRVACYWNAHNTHMNPGKVIQTDRDVCRIKFDDRSDAWMPNEWIHGLKEALHITRDIDVFRVEPYIKYPRQIASARYSREGVKCDHIASFSSRFRLYEGHYDDQTGIFTAHDGGEKRMEFNGRHVYPIGKVFEEGDRVACYWRHDDKHLCPGTVSISKLATQDYPWKHQGRGYSCSLVYFDDGDAAWIPNDAIHHIGC